MVKHVVDKSLSHFPWHALLHVLTHKVAISASQLAVLGDDEGDSLRHTRPPGFLFFFYLIHYNAITRISSTCGTLAIVFARSVAITRAR